MLVVVPLPAWVTLALAPAFSFALLPLPVVGLCPIPFAVGGALPRIDLGLTWRGVLTDFLGIGFGLVVVVADGICVKAGGDLERRELSSCL